MLFQQGFGPSDKWLEPMFGMSKMPDNSSERAWEAIHPRSFFQFEVPHSFLQRRFLMIRKVRQTLRH